MATRLGTLLMAASCLVGGSNVAAAAYAGVCFLASLLPIFLPHLRDLLATPAPLAGTAPAPGVGAGSSGWAPSPAAIGLPLLASDAAFLLALAPSLQPAVRLVAGAGLAASLAAAAVGAAASGRLDARRAAVGDDVTFHVTLRLPNGAPLDTTLGHMPLRAVVTPAPPPDVATDSSEVGGAEVGQRAEVGQKSRGCSSGPGAEDSRELGQSWVGWAEGCISGSDGQRAGVVHPTTLPHPEGVAWLASAAWRPVTSLACVACAPLPPCPLFWHSALRAGKCAVKAACVLTRPPRTPLGFHHRPACRLDPEKT